MADATSESSRFSSSIQWRENSHFNSPRFFSAFFFVCFYNIIFCRTNWFTLKQLDNSPSLSKGAFTLADLGWIWTETGLVSDLPVAFTLNWSSSGLWLKCDVSVQHCYKTSSEQLFHHSNQTISSPNSVWLRSHLIESNPNPFSIHFD